MTSAKTLMLAAVTALTLSAGAAMAQEQGGPSFASEYWTIPALPGTAASAVRADQGQNPSIQFGSSDRGQNDGMRAYDEYNPYAGGN